VLQPFEPVERAVRLDRDDPHPADFLAQPATHPHQGAGRAEARDEVGDAPAGLIQDLEAGRPVVGLPVGGIGILVGIEVTIPSLGGDPARLEDGPVRSGQRVGET